MSAIKIWMYCWLCFQINSSCKHSVQNINTEKVKPIRPEIDVIVNQIPNYKTVDAGGVGIAGVKTEQYERFEKLIKYANVEELIKLTDHESPAVRAYSFWALSKKHFTALQLVLKRHVNDTSTFRFFSGCIYSIEKINNFYAAIKKDKR